MLMSGQHTASVGTIMFYILIHMYIYIYDIASKSKKGVDPNRQICIDGSFRVTKAAARNNLAGMARIPGWSWE